MPLHSTGVPDLDRVIGGGASSGSLVLVMHAAGSGKTPLALRMAFSSLASSADRKVPPERSAEPDDEE